MKMQCRAARRLPGIALMTIIFPLRMPKAYAVGILNRFAPRDCCTKLCGSPFLRFHAAIGILHKRTVAF